MNPSPLTLALLLAATFAAAQSQLPHPSGKREQIRAQGCVEAGVENSCLLARDLRTGKTYTLLVKGIAPAVGIGIEFAGEVHNGPSSCMQGIAVDVTTWTHKEAIKCPHRPTTKK